MTENKQKMRSTIHNQPLSVYSSEAIPGGKEPLFKFFSRKTQNGIPGSNSSEIEKFSQVSECEIPSGTTGKHGRNWNYA